MRVAHTVKRRGLRGGTVSQAFGEIPLLVFDEGENDLGQPSTVASAFHHLADMRLRHAMVDGPLSFRDPGFGKSDPPSFQQWWRCLLDLPSSAHG